MADDMLYYKVKLKTIGPLFIGDGGTLAKSEYVLNRNVNKVYVIDTLKMYNGLKRLNLLNEYEKFVMKGNADLYYFIKENNLLKEYEKWSKYSYYIDKAILRSRFEIKTFIKDAYLKPYVPGSSLKGAVRNAMLNGELIENNSEYKGIAAEVSNERFRNRTGYMRVPSNKIELSLKYIKDNKDEDTYSIFSGFMVSDSKPLSENDIILCGKKDVSPNGKVSNIPILRECIKPGTTIEFTVKIDRKKFNYNAEDIYKYINIMYNNTKNKFLSSFKSISADRINIKNPIYVGGGSGYVSKTATYSLFENKDRAVKVTSEILHNTTPRAKKADLDHRLDFEKYRVSPRKRKCTEYRGETYDFGLCSVNFEPIG